MGHEVLGRLEGDDSLLLFWCPGCRCLHHLDTTRWTWNGDAEVPDVSPSILNHSDGHRPRCHLFVRRGQIQFCGDCEHPLAGKTVDMAPWARVNDDWNSLDP